MTADVNFKGVRHSYRRLKERAEAVRRSRWRRAQDLCEAAGLSDAGHLHNALVAYNRGKPWRSVDYSAARAAKRLFDSQFVADRWLSALYERRGPQGFTWD